MGALAANESATPEGAGSKALYVYGVVRADAKHPPLGTGVTGAGIEFVQKGGLAAVVSEIPGEMLRVRRRDLREHLRVLETLFAETTVVPCSFGTVLPSREAVGTDLLDTRRRELNALLTRLEDHAQLNVKAAYDGDGVLREILAGEPEIARLRERVRGLGDAAYYDNVRLGELVASALQAHREQVTARVLGRLAPLAADLAVEDADGDDVALKASFLVPRDALSRFDAELDAVARDEAPTLRFESIGPLPPTAFAALETEAQAWV